MKSKLLSIVLAFVLVLALCVPALAEGGLSEAGVYPIWTGDEPYVLKVLVAANAHVSDWDDNTFTKWVEEKCNVDLQFEFLPEVEPKQKLTIMLDTNEELPDVVLYGLSVAEAYNYGSKGKFVNLREYLDDGLGVNIDSAVERFPTWNLITNITNSDGSVYAVPKIQASPQNETKYKLWINKTYLDNLDLDMPTTTDEFREVLEAFRDNDANGDGDPNDEIPLLGSPSSWGSNPVKFLTNAFVAEDDRDMWLIKDGHVEASYTQDEWFEAVEYIKGLVDDKLMAPESFTYGRPEIKAVAGTAGNKVGALFDSSLGFFGSDTEELVEARLRFWPAEPLTGPEGVRYVSYNQSSTSPLWFVTSFCKNPELAFRVGDVMFCEEAYMLGRFGVEGENWIKTEDYLAKHPNAEISTSLEGYEPTYVSEDSHLGEIVNVFLTAQNVNWFDQMPTFSGVSDYHGGFISKYEDGYEVNWENSGGVRQNSITGVYQQYAPTLDGTYCPNLNFTTEELEEISEIRATIKSFVNEQRTNYVLGRDSMISDPEAFKAELETIGLSKLLEVADAAYQRQYAE